MEQFELSSSSNAWEFFVKVSFAIAIASTLLGIYLLPGQLVINERIQNEELLLRKLLTEIREHRREVKILQSQLASGGGTMAANYHGTIAAHLATLRETRSGITGAVSVSDDAEASMEEMMERVNGDPVTCELNKIGCDESSVHLEAVISRLKTAIVIA